MQFNGAVKHAVLTSLYSRYRYPGIDTITFNNYKHLFPYYICKISALILDWCAQRKKESKL